MNDRRPDAIIQATVDRRSLATILHYLIDQGYQPLSRGEFYRTIVEEFEALLEANGAQTFEDTKEAHEYLASQILGGWNPREKLRSNLLANLALETTKRRQRDGHPRTHHRRRV